MPISVVFDPPLPSDSPSTFNTKAFTLLGDLNDWSTQANALPGEVATNLTTLLAAPPAIGSTTPAAGSFTTLTSTTDGNGKVVVATTGDVSAAGYNYLQFKHNTSTASGYVGYGGVAGKFTIANALASGIFSITTGGYTDRFTIDAAGAVTIPGSLSITGGTFGYGIGAGGTVTQATSKSTDVTLNKPSGQITMNNAALAAGATVVFNVTNSYVVGESSINLQIRYSGTGGGPYSTQVIAINTGSFDIALRNNGASPLSDAVVLNFSVISGATS